MKKLCIAILLTAGCYQLGLSQAVGYQGKKFIVEAGFSPATNLLLRYLDYSMVNDAIPEGERAPTEFKIIPRVSFEAVIFNSGSFFVRANPYNYSSTLSYLDKNYDEVHLMQLDTKGFMFSIGYKSYNTPTPAPLGSYWGFNVTRYNFNSSYENSPDDSQGLPNEISDYLIAESGCWGLFVSYGAKNIFWDKMTLDISLEGGYFFNNPEVGLTMDDNAFGNDFEPIHLEYPQSINLTNTRAFFFIMPTIQLGYLF
ncbi:MAG TPA: hypothetical protein PK511_04995 [Chitinophagales bacterium]|nr:hypothetical protein [Chitinophagales bacterium]HMU68366.1 hypothetical protein [Chitinophagales bacterium]HMX03900.1 hypothetical protein [Chitinophagales bacterium]HMZ89582.1 hypothetical protein [Chitinophagales bacterium]HNA56939.1 hypothetical protein [Chitinophagales bacterium]